MKCRFDMAWAGKCDKEATYPDGRCKEHTGLKCQSCQSPATRECDHTGIQFVCGYPLCDECKHGTPDPKNPGVFALGGGHHPKKLKQPSPHG